MADHYTVCEATQPNTLPNEAEINGLSVNPSTDGYDAATCTFDGVSVSPICKCEGSAQLLSAEEAAACHTEAPLRDSLATGAEPGDEQPDEACVTLTPSDEADQPRGSWVGLSSEEMLAELHKEAEWLKERYPEETGPRAEYGDSPLSAASELDKPTEGGPVASSLRAADVAAVMPDLKLLHLLCRYADLRQKGFWELALDFSMFGTPLGQSGEPLRKLAHILVNFWHDGDGEFDADELKRMLREWRVCPDLALATFMTYQLVTAQVTAEPDEFDSLASQIRARWEKHRIEPVAESVHGEVTGRLAADSSTTDKSPSPGRPADGEANQEPYKPPAWFDTNDPAVARILPDLQVLFLTNIYGDDEQGAFSYYGLEPSLLGGGLGPVTVAIQTLATFFRETLRDGRRHPTQGQLGSWLAEQGVDEEEHEAVFEVFDVVRFGVDAFIGDRGKLVAEICEREGQPLPPQLMKHGSTENAEEDSPRPQPRPRKRDRMEDKYPNCFWELKTPYVTRYCSLPYLLDGSTESLVDVLVAQALLWGRLDFAKAAKAKVYFSVTCNVSELAERTRKRPEAVKASLARLESQRRIHLPRPPQRGRNSIQILIGVQNGVLFAPVLSPMKLWNMSTERYLRAYEQRDPGTMAKELVRLTRHHRRLPEDTEIQKGNKAKALAILERFRAGIDDL